MIVKCAPAYCKAFVVVFFSIHLPIADCCFPCVGNCKANVISTNASHGTAFTFVRCVGRLAADVFRLAACLVLSDCGVAQRYS